MVEEIDYLKDYKIQDLEYSYNKYKIMKIKDFVKNC